MTSHMAQRTDTGDSAGTSNGSDGHGHGPSSESRDFGFAVPSSNSNSAYPRHLPHLSHPGSDPLLASAALGTGTGTPGPLTATFQGYPGSGSYGPPTAASGYGYPYGSNIAHDPSLAANGSSMTGHSSDQGPGTGTGTGTGTNGPITGTSKDEPNPFEMSFRPTAPPQQQMDYPYQPPESPSVGLIPPNMTPGMWLGAPHSRMPSFKWTGSNNGPPTAGGPWATPGGPGGYGPWGNSPWTPGPPMGMGMGMGIPSPFSPPGGPSPSANGGAAPSPGTNGDPNKPVVILPPPIPSPAAMAVPYGAPSEFPWNNNNNNNNAGGGGASNAATTSGQPNPNPTTLSATLPPVLSVPTTASPARPSLARRNSAPGPADAEPNQPAASTHTNQSLKPHPSPIPSAAFELHPPQPRRNSAAHSTSSAASIAAHGHLQTADRRTPSADVAATLAAQAARSSPAPAASALDGFGQSPYTNTGGGSGGNMSGIGNRTLDAARTLDPGFAAAVTRALSGNISAGNSGSGNLQTLANAGSTSIGAAIGLSANIAQQPASQLIPSSMPAGLAANMAIARAVSGQMSAADALGRALSTNPHQQQQQQQQQQTDPMAAIRARSQTIQEKARVSAALEAQAHATALQSQFQPIQPLQEPAGPMEQADPGYYPWNPSTANNNPAYNNQFQFNAWTPDGTQFSSLANQSQQQGQGQGQYPFPTASMDGYNWPYPPPGFYPGYPNTPGYYPYGQQQQVQQGGQGQGQGQGEPVGVVDDRLTPLVQAAAAADYFSARNNDSNSSANATASAGRGTKRAAASGPTVAASFDEKSVGSPEVEKVVGSGRGGGGAKKVKGEEPDKRKEFLERNRLGGYFSRSCGFLVFEFRTSWLTGRPSSRLSSLASVLHSSFPSLRSINPAAMKCRQKKKEHLDALKSSFEETTLENSLLEREIAQLGAEVDRMRGILGLCARGGCRVR